MLGVSVGDPAGVALLPPKVEGQLVVRLVGVEAASAAARSPAAGGEAAQKAAESLSPLEHEVVTLAKFSNYALDEDQT